MVVIDRLAESIRYRIHDPRSRNPISYQLMILVSYRVVPIESKRPFDRSIEMTDLLRKSKPRRDCQEMSSGMAMFEAEKSILVNSLSFQARLFRK